MHVTNSVKVKLLFFYFHVKFKCRIKVVWLDESPNQICISRFSANRSTVKRYRDAFSWNLRNLFTNKMIKCPNRRSPFELMDPIPSIRQNSSRVIFFKSISWEDY